MLKRAQQVRGAFLLLVSFNGIRINVKLLLVADYEMQASTN